jgi:heptosyltransferase-2
MTEVRLRLLRAAAAMARPFDRQATAPADTGAILLCATGGLGNAVLLQPLVSALRRGCPAARIDLLLTSMAAADLLRVMGWADGVETMSEGEWHSGRALFLRFAGPLRARRYDWVLRTFLTAPEAARASLAAYLSGAPVRAAFGAARANPLETLVVADDANSAETDRHLALADALGVPRPDSWRPASPPREGSAWAERFVAEHQLVGRLIGLHAGSDSRYTAKRWPAARFGELAVMIAARLGAQPVVFGGPDDAEANAVVMKTASGAAIAASGQGIGATVGLIARCDAFVSNDSGLMHVASLLGVPTLALFGPSHPGKNRPLDPDTRILRLDLPCSPCSRQHAMIVCDHHDCLRSLEVATVFAELVRLLETRGTPTAGGDKGAADGRVVFGEEPRCRR